MGELEKVMPFDEQEGKFVSSSPRGSITFSEFVTDPWNAVEIQGLEALDRGGGKNIMQAIASLADRLKITLVAYTHPFPSKSGRMLGQEELEAFYSRFGFRLADDMNEPYDDGTWMIRKPKKGKLRHISESYWSSKDRPTQFWFNIKTKKLLPLESMHHVQYAFDHQDMFGYRFPSEFRRDNPGFEMHHHLREICARGWARINLNYRGQLWVQAHSKQDAATALRFFRKEANEAAVKWNSETNQDRWDQNELYLTGPKEIMQFIGSLNEERGAYVYHATLNFRIESIYNDGLVNNPKDRNWYFKDTPEGAIYFTSSPKQARWYINSVVHALKDRQGREDVFLVMLRTRVSNLKLVRDKQTEGDFYTTVSVPPNKLEILHQGQWQPLRSLSRIAIEEINDGHLSASLTEARLAFTQDDFQKAVAEYGEYPSVEFAMDQQGNIRIISRRSNGRLPYRQAPWVTLYMTDKEIRVRTAGNQLLPGYQQLLAGLRKAGIIDDSWKIIGRGIGRYVGHKYEKEPEDYVDKPISQITSRSSSRLDPAGTDLIFYHGTSNVDAERIMKFGLRSLDESNVDHGFESRAKHSGNAGVVYLTTTMEKAWQYAQTRAESVKRQRKIPEYVKDVIYPVILKITLPDASKLVSDDDAVNEIARDIAERLWKKKTPEEKARLYPIMAQNSRVDIRTAENLGAFLWRETEEGFAEILSKIPPKAWKAWMASIRRRDQVGYKGRIPPAWIETRLRESAMESTDMRTVYHVTEKRRVPKIMKDGLIPRIGKSARSAGETTKAIYAFPDLVSLVDGVTNWLGDETEYRQSVLALTIPPDWITEDDVRYEVTIRRPVPPEMIRVAVPDIEEWDGASVNEAVMESMDRVLPSTVIMNTKHRSGSAFITPNGIIYSVYFKSMEYTPEDWEMYFESDIHGTKNSNSGDEFWIFATVLSITEQFIKSRKPKSIAFTGSKGEGKADLYSVMARRFTPRLDQLGYYIDVEPEKNETYFYINRKPIAESMPSDVQAILQRAKQMGFSGFGNDCGQAAVAINRVLFSNTGGLVGGFNVFFMENGYPIGHVAVEKDGVYWDADGKPKHAGEILSWGMLAVDDPDYQERAREMGEEWTEARAEDTAMYELSEQEALVFGSDKLDAMIAILKRAVG